MTGRLRSRLGSVLLNRARSYGVATFVILAAMSVCITQADAGAAVPTAPATQAEQPPAALPAAGESEIKPRLELYVRSVGKLIAEVERSHSGVFAAEIGRMMLERARAFAEGIDADEASAIAKLIRSWPDTSLGMVTFAPDSEGRARWAIRVEWPLQELHGNAQKLVDSGVAADLLEGITLAPTPAGAYQITLPQSTLGYLLAGDEDYSYVASHAGLPLPTGLFAGTPETEGNGSSLLVCRLNLAGTEKDSGATFLSSFSVVTDVVFAARVDAEGDWVESLHLHWPPISGMGAKALFGKVKQTFFVPKEAFAAAAFKSLLAPGMLDGLAGFGPQVMVDSPGEMTIVGEAGVGPIASSVGSELCITLLPGTGFLPMPDIVIQSKAKRAEKLMDDLEEAANEVNKLYREREQREPWHRATVRDRTVLWSDGANRYPGMMMPLMMRPVLFTTKETDARDRERGFLVLGFTSTSPKGFVRRWVDLPRSKDRHYLPAKKKTNGQLWVNWKQVYKWAGPYINVALGMVVPDALLPRAEQVASRMTDAVVTVKTRYTGLGVTHRGPVPAGVLVVPALVSASIAADEFGGSDLARERLASQRLKVLHHHSELFKADVGRWPAEVAELDGYVDFAGHPELLELKLSSRKQWSEWFEGFFKAGEEDESEDDEDDEEDEESGIDDDLYVIEWGRDSWRLGLAPGTLEHLEKLFIDQDGRIHRVEKVGEGEGDKESKSGESVDGLSSAAALEQVVRNVHRKYYPTRVIFEKE